MYWYTALLQKRITVLSVNFNKAGAFRWKILFIRDKMNKRNLNCEGKANMRDSLFTLCENFIENRSRIESAFGWESIYLYPVCAAVFTDKRKLADIGQMKRCRDILKEQTGIFSDFRGNAKLAVISMLAVDEDAEGKFQRALQVHTALKEHFFSSPYLSVASMIIADLAEQDRYEEIAARTRQIYNRMKQEHPFLTSGEDSVLAALLAFSSLTDEQIVQETETCYELLKAKFFAGNAVQSLSHVLALGEGPANEKCRRTMELYDGLKERGYRYGTGYELATLGVLALLPSDTAVVMKDIMEVDDFLSRQKGYGFFGLDKKQRLMHAGMLVSCDYIGKTDNLAMNTAAIGGTISLIAAQEMAMCAAIAASTAAAASANSSN